MNLTFPAGNAWAYLRRSRDEENDPHLLAKHRSELLRLAAADGIAIPAEHVLEEIGSADQIDSRPVFRELLRAWERLPRGAGGVIYSTEVSRLTRGLQSQQGRVQDALIRAGIRHRTRSRWYDLSLPDDCTAWELEAFVARLEYRLLKARSAAAFSEMLRAGRVRTGSVPFGYQWSKDEKNPVAVPGKFEVLCRCCQEVHATSVNGLAKRYGVPETTLRRSLNNPLICGYPCRRYAPRDPDDPTRAHWRLLPRAEWDWPETVNDGYPHACSREEWEVIQQLTQGRLARHSLPDYTNGWCRDLVWFPQAPGLCRLSVYIYPSDGRRVLTYERRPPTGLSLSVPREMIHAAAYEQLEAFFRRPHWLRLSQEQIRAAPETAPGAALDAARRQLAQLRSRYEETVDAEMDATDTHHRQALARRRLRLQQELDRQQVELNDQRARPDPAAAFRRLMEALPDPTHFPALWAAADGPRRRDIAEGVLRRIEVSVICRPRRHERTISAIRYQPWIAAEG